MACSCNSGLICIRKYFKDNKLNLLCSLNFMLVSLKYLLVLINPELHSKSFDYQYKSWLIISSFCYHVYKCKNWNRQISATF